MHPIIIKSNWKRRKDAHNPSLDNLCRILQYILLYFNIPHKFPNWEPKRGFLLLFFRLFSHSRRTCSNVPFPFNSQFDPYSLSIKNSHRFTIAPISLSLCISLSSDQLTSKYSSPKKERYRIDNGSQSCYENKRL